ncbi:MAG: lipid-transfer protein [Nocardioides sp.]|uniref:thiolase C-terminal domain-containing protein n=1 Tax=Nocardioides sp. TaxID=35761 RepID=UPI0039E2AD68
MRTAAITGVGYTAFTKESGTSVLSLAREACATAIEDAGIDRARVDGVSTYQVMGDSVSPEATATALGLGNTRYILDFNQGGQSPSWMVWLAALAVQNGVADNVLVYRALNGRSGFRVGSAVRGGASQYRVPIGYDAYLMYIAMWVKRFMHETGATQDDLAAVAITQRAYAQANPRAILKRPLDADSYAASPWVAEPFKVADCTTEVDGGCAVLVSAIDEARDLRHAPVIVASGGYVAGAGAGLDIGDQLNYRDYGSNFTNLLRDDLFGRAGLTPADVDFAEIYDCFSAVPLMSLEGLGLVERGGAGELVRSGGTELGGRLPVNTHGGLLAEGYLHGMNTVAEAVLQMRGDQGDRQVPRREVAAVTSGALNNGSALLLTQDH